MNDTKMEGDYPNLGNIEYQQPHRCPPRTNNVGKKRVALHPVRVISKEPST